MCQRKSAVYTDVRWREKQGKKRTTEMCTHTYKKDKRKKPNN